MEHAIEDAGLLELFISKCDDKVIDLSRPVGTGCDSPLMYALKKR